MTIKLCYTQLMILFFYGEDTYRLKQKIKDLKEKYISASLGDTNLAVLDGKTTNYNEIMRQILAFPFLAKSRLVIIENLLMESKKSASSKAGETSSKAGGIQEKMIEGIKKVPETTVLVFAEAGKPDKRTTLFKRLNKEKAQEFKPLEEFEVKKWIKTEVDNQGGQIESAAIDLLYQYVGSDLWRLTNEIQKLITYNSKISAENIELLVRTQIQSDIFALIDALASKNYKSALRELYRLLDAGENELYILTMIVYQYRNLIIVRDFMDRGVNSQWEIAKMAGIHPYVAGKTLNQARNYTLDELKNIYNTLQNFDINMKTGRIEPQTALDLLIAKLC